MKTSRGNLCLLSTLFLFLLSFGFLQAFGQTLPPSWIHYQPTPYPNNAYFADSWTLPNGHFLFVGGQSNQGTFLQELDEYGRILRETEYLGVANAASKVIPLANGNMAMIGQRPNGFTNVYSLDTAWNPLWLSGFSGPVTSNIGGLYDILQTPDGGFMLAGYQDVNPTGFPEYRPRLTKLNAAGQVVWDNMYYSMPRSAFGHIRLLPSGDLIGMENRVVRDSVYLSRFSSTGTLLWEKAIPGIGGINSYSSSNGLAMEMGVDHNIWVAYQSNSQGQPGDFQIVKLDSNGTMLFKKFPIVPINLAVCEDLTLYPNDGGAVLYKERPEPSNGALHKLLRFDQAGDSVWAIDILLPPGSQITSLDTTNDRGFVACGYYREVSNFTPHPFAIRVDSLGKFYLNQLSGTLFLDQNSNCTLDPTEPVLPGWLIKADPTAGYALTNSAGRFQFELGQGSHWISIQSLFNNHSLNCSVNDSILVTFPGINDTLTGFDIPVDLSDSCPVLQVDITSIPVRVCENNQLYVNYINMGLTQATNTYVEVELDTAYTLVSTSIPYSIVGPNLFRFDLGTLTPFQQGNFTMVAAMSCSTALGEAICNTAHIYPDSFCQPPHPGWNDASLSVSGTCIPGDSVRFTLSNDGTGNMLVPSGFIVVEDDVLKSTGSVQLNANSDSSITFAGNGSTWALFANQVDFHPGNSLPRAFVEGCGLNSSNEFSVGHVVPHPQDDHFPFLSIDCQEARAALDPNDKQGFPKGVGTDHAIESTDQMEYLVRFQNTGNDTAFKVVIRDQIAPSYDLSTFRMLATSHQPYSVQFYPDRVVEWTFEPIALPDSATDDLGSQGFLKFSIDQVQSPPNAPGTLIENYVDIYFDHNPAVRTNTAWHTIYEEIFVAIDEELPQSELAPELLVYPNPSQDQVTFALPDEWYSFLEIEVFDQQGGLVREVQFDHTNSFSVRCSDLPAGIYFFRLYGEGAFLKSGKIMVVGR